jgi:hypothetical protein
MEPGSDPGARGPPEKRQILDALRMGGKVTVVMRALAIGNKDQGDPPKPPTGIEALFRLQPTLPGSDVLLEASWLLVVIDYIGAN